MIKKEIVLQDTFAEKVRKYLHDKLEELENKTFTDENFRYHSNYAYDNYDKISFDCSVSQSNDNSISKTHGWPIVEFTILQLQTSTVKVKAKYGVNFFHSILDTCWNDMLKDFGQSSEEPKNEPWKLSPIHKQERDKLIWNLRQQGAPYEHIVSELSRLGIPYRELTTVKDQYKRMEDLTKVMNIHGVTQKTLTEKVG